MKRLVFIFLILLSCSLMALNNKISESTNDTTVYSTVDKNANYPGGEKAMLQFIHAKMNYQKLNDNDVWGRIFVQFIVEKDGNLSNINITRSLDPFCDKEAMRIVKIMPKWKPGKLNNINVRTKIEIPIIIKFE